MQFNDFIKNEILGVEPLLINYLLDKKQELTKINPLLEPLFMQFIESSKEGKRLRALLVKLGYQMAGGQNIKAIVDPMLAVEIFHTSILAHDDIIDQSPLRRGKPTLYHALGKDHHAISQTIVLADYGLFLANKLISESAFDSAKKNKALQRFNDIVLDTIIGEIIDVEIPFQKVSLTQKDSLTISLFKTARYTITGPIQIGAILAGADEKSLQKLQIFGDNLGIAFQIQDDILGVFGMVDETGKSNMSDLEEGKVTLLAAFAFKNASDDQKKTLKKIYGKKNLTSDEAEKIRQIFRDCGALDFSHESALKYTNSAKKAVESLTVNENWKSMLLQWADFLMDRKK